MMLLEFNCQKCGKPALVAPSSETIQYSEKTFRDDPTKNVTVRCPYCGTWNTVKIQK
jgi:DNA-directed RNA polymerase subunit RPC12/RpoP